MRSDSIVWEKSRKFAIRIVNLYRHLCDEKHEYVISKQILRSGTSIGANIHEAEYGQSKRDFTAKMSIALKEAAETEYWLMLLFEAKHLEEGEYITINTDCVELIKMLTSIVKTSKQSEMPEI